MSYKNSLTIEKYRAVQSRVNALYKEGLRMDFIYDKIRNEFFIGKSRVDQILRMDLSDIEISQEVKEN